MTDHEKPATVDLQQAYLDPGSVFATPEAVLSCETLSKEQKVEVLRRWAYDASEEEVAEEEGMPPREGSLLRSVLQALAQAAPDLDLDLDRVDLTKQHGIPRSAIKPE